MEIDSEQQALASSTPKDESGDGPVTLESRTEPSGEGSPGSNQAKTEPVSPTGTHSQPPAAPDLDDMNLGGADPQAPRHPDALDSGASAKGAYASEPPGARPAGLGGPGEAVEANRPEVDLTSSTGRAPGPEVPLSSSSGSAHRAPGQPGTTPAGESVESDTSAGAARMGPQALDSTGDPAPGQGDDQGVPSSATSPSPGTSEEHRVVSGVKLPKDDES